MRKSAMIFALLILSIIPFAAPVQALPGDSDPTFGTDGSTLLDISPVNLMMDTQGRIVTMGDDRSNVGQQYVYRLTANGQTDQTFGSEGRVNIFEFDPGEFVSVNGYNFALDALNRVVVTLTYTDYGLEGVQELALMRLNTDGTQDMTFGVNGFARITLTEMGMGYDYPAHVAVLPDGKILLVVYKGDFGGYTNQFAFMRFNSDGTLDTTYDGDGKSIVTLNADSGTINHLIIDNLGRPVIVGSQYEATGYQAIAIRLTTEGARDASFDGDGLKRLFVGEATSVAEDASGNLAIIGHNYTKGIYFTRLFPNGLFDTSIGTEVKHIIISGFGATSNDLLIAPDGKILASGALDAAGGPELDTAGGIFRIKPNNAKLDKTFGIEGIASTVSARLSFMAFDANGGLISIDGVGRVQRNLPFAELPVELAYNGSFEIRGYYNFMADGWTFSRYDMDFSGRDCFYGLYKKCLLDFDDEPFSAKQVLRVQGVQGGTMTLSTWVETLGTTGAKLKALVKYADGSTQLIDPNVPQNSSSIWVYVTQTVQLKPNVPVRKVKIVVSARESRSNFDGISLRYMPPGGGRSEAVRADVNKAGLLPLPAAPTK